LSFSINFDHVVKFCIQDDVDVPSQSSGGGGGGGGIYPSISGGGGVYPSVCGTASLPFRLLLTVFGFSVAF
jgi:hypothetical protein